MKKETSQTSMPTEFLPCVVPPSMHTPLTLFQMCHFDFLLVLFVKVLLELLISNLVVIHPISQQFDAVVR